MRSPSFGYRWGAVRGDGVLTSHMDVPTAAPTRDGWRYAECARGDHVVPGKDCTCGMYFCQNPRLLEVSYAAEAERIRLLMRRPDLFVGPIAERRDDAAYYRQNWRGIHVVNKIEIRGPVMRGLPDAQGWQTHATAFERRCRAFRIIRTYALPEVASLADRWCDDVRVLPSQDWQLFWRFIKDAESKAAWNARRPTS